MVGAVVLSRKATAGHNGLIGGFHLGYLGWYLAKRDRERCRKVFEGKKPSEILSLEQDNFEILYNDISSVTLHKGLLSSSIEFEMFREEGQEKLKFNFSPKQFSGAKKTIRKVLNDKLKGSFSNG